MQWDFMEYFLYNRVLFREIDRQLDRDRKKKGLKIFDLDKVYGNVCNLLVFQEFLKKEF